MSEDKIAEIWLQPQVKATSEAVKALLEADVIILCPGTTYGSVLPNLLPTGMVDAYNKSKAKKILMTNILATANEVKDASQRGYVDIFKKYLKTNSPFDLVLMANMLKLNKKTLKRVLDFYKLEHAVLVKPVKDKTIKTVIADIAMIEAKNMRLRHSEDKMGEFFKTWEF